MKREDLVQGKTYNIRMTNGGRRVDAKYVVGRDVSFGGQKAQWRYYFTSQETGREVKLKSLLSVEEPEHQVGVLTDENATRITLKPLADAGPLDHWPDRGSSVYLLPRQHGKSSFAAEITADVLGVDLDEPQKVPRSRKCPDHFCGAYTHNPAATHCVCGLKLA